MKRIEEGIYQIVSPFPSHRPADAYSLRASRERNPATSRGLAYVMPYLVESRGHSLLIDCGWNTDEALLALHDQLREVGCSLASVETIVLTHTHPDHCGLAGRLAGESGCTVAVHQLDVARVEGQSARDEELGARFGAWCDRCGVPLGERGALAVEDLPRSLFATPFPVHRSLRGGELLPVGDFVLEVLWTPGHTPGHVCLFDHQRGILFTGDHVLPWITPNVSLDSYQRENPLQDFLESLHTIRKLPVKRMLPAHEWDTMVFANRITHLLAHHETRLHEVGNALRRQCGGTALDVARRVRWSSGDYGRFTPWMQRAALGEALAHLVFLVSQGRALEYKDGGLTYFQAL